jgi:hypothetical protein
VSCPPAILQKLKLQRESLAHGTPHQDWLADWWKQLIVDQRRTLLAISGLDDGVETARRPWHQFTADQRDTLIAECKKIARLVGAVEWA